MFRVQYNEGVTMKIKSKQVWVDEELKPAVVVFEEGKITGILGYDADADVDYGDYKIFPGFIDIHTHGYNGCNGSKPTDEGLRMWMNSAPKEGLTSILVTTATQAYEDNIKALEAISAFMEKEYEGTEILGINMEGNFICHEFKGAQNPDFIVAPNVKELADYINASNHQLRTVLCAPERDENYEFVKYAVKEGVSVSAGHSAATYDDIKGAVKHGLTGITHTGNGMRPFHHREPGIYGASMNMDEIYSETIGDGVHVNFEAVNVLGRMKGKDRLVLVTDSGMEKGKKDFEGNVDLETGAIYTDAGVLCGSSLPYYKVFHNLIEKARLPLVTVVNAATINPARYIKKEDKKGSIEVNKDADFVVMDDDYQLVQVYCRGKEQL